MGRRLENSLHDVSHDRVDGRPGERSHASETFVQNHAQGVLIGACVDCVTGRLFGRKVVRRTYDVACAGQAGVVIADA